MQLIECSKRIFGTNKFIFYAVTDGLFALLAKYKQGNGISESEAVV